jgi:hypothetical protein
MDSAICVSCPRHGDGQYTMTDLSFQRNENVTWIDWTSNKTAYNKAVYPDMCGTWRSDTAWRAGEPDGSCN